WALAAPGGSASAAVPIQRASGTGSPVQVVAAENEYGNVAAQVGGRYAKVSSIETNPNTDPHTYEVSPRVAREVSGARLVIQNGVGYDAFMERIESASPSSARRVINVQQLLGLPDSTPNPHLWYKPTTMPKVATAVAADLTKLDPAHRAYFHANAKRFISSLKPWMSALAHLKASYPGAPVATTEPVSDYLLQAAGINNLTPFRFQADIMNGVDPSPQDVSQERSLFSQHRVKVFVYNQQVTDSLTESFITDARKAGIPVVGVYETMPVPGYDYQSWMVAEVHALQSALANKVSTTRLTGGGA
ncbi:MAG: zinc ABC transporter substrate-binding protein, partial [Acidimicrobiales bacterium]|nr:zinc ABC transporter substrate-binding protein [Acidimicrobiales bacterium]